MYLVYFSTILKTQDPLCTCAFQTAGDGKALPKERFAVLIRVWVRLLAASSYTKAFQAAWDASTCLGVAFELLSEPISIFNCFGLAASFFCRVIERTPFS